MTDFCKSNPDSCFFVMVGNFASKITISNRMLSYRLSNILYSSVKIAIHEILLKIALMIIILIVGGCVTFSAPKNNLEFTDIVSANQLGGIYRNKGDPSGYLSTYIFAGIDAGSTPHYNIEFIQVLVNGKNLQLNAIQNECIMHSEELTYGKDFKVADGKIELLSNFEFSARGIVGAGYTSNELGLDTGGNGKLITIRTGAALAFLVMPFAMHDVSEVKFLRVDDSRSFAKCDFR